MPEKKNETNKIDKPRERRISIWSLEKIKKSVKKTDYRGERLQRGHAELMDDKKGSEFSGRQWAGAAHRVRIPLMVPGRRLLPPFACTPFPHIPFRRVPFPRPNVAARRLALRRRLCGIPKEAGRPSAPIKDGGKAIFSWFLRLNKLQLFRMPELILKMPRVKPMWPTSYELIYHARSEGAFVDIHGPPSNAKSHRSRLGLAIRFMLVYLFIVNETPRNMDKQRSRSMHRFNGALWIKKKNYGEKYWNWPL